MKKNVLILLIAFMAPLFLLGQTKQTWKNDPAHSRLGFSVRHMTISDIKGYFSDFETTVTYTEPDYSDINIRVVAKVASINTGIEMRDNHLKAVDFFDVENYPEMIFVSTSFDKTGNETGKLYGELTFHGETKPVVLDVTYFGTVTNPMSNEETAGFKITGTINRKDYNLGMSFADNFISDKVDIVADVEFTMAK